MDEPRVSVGKDRIGAPEVRIAAAKRRKMGEKSLSSDAYMLHEHDVRTHGSTAATNEG